MEPKTLDNRPTFNLLEVISQLPNFGEGYNIAMRRSLLNKIIEQLTRYYELLDLIDTYQAPDKRLLQDVLNHIDSKDVSNGDVFYLMVSIMYAFGRRLGDQGVTESALANNRKDFGVQAVAAYRLFQYIIAQDENFKMELSTAMGAVDNYLERMGANG